MFRYAFLVLLLSACASNSSPSSSASAVVAPPAPATPAAAETPPKAAAAIKAMVEKYSLDQLSQASNYLLARAESDPMKKNKKAPQILKCDPPTETAMQWASGQLRALTDDKVQAELVAYKKSPAAFASRIKSCANACTCSSYAALLEQVDGSAAESAEHKANATSLRGQLTRGSAKQTLKCAKNAQWFCGSPLENFLKTEG